MRMRSLSHIVIVLFSVLFVLFILGYQYYAVSTIRQKIAEHVAVITPFLWNYDKNYIAYLTLAAQANNYASIVIRDRLGLEHSEIVGPPPKAVERWLMALKLIPLYRFQADIEHEGEKVGTISVIWRCTTIYIYIYVGLSLAILAIGIRLSIKLKFTNTQLETQNEQLQQEIAERQRVETVLKQVHDELEHRVRERTAELTNANKALRENEQQFRDITKNIPGMVYQFRVRPDSSAYFSYASPRASELFGLPDDLDSEQWELGARLHPDDRESFFTSISQAIEQCSDWNYEGRMLLPDGGMNWFQGISSPMRVDDELVFNGILLDITERKRTEEALQESEAKYRLLVENIRDVVWTMDINYRFTSISPSIIHLRGLTPEEALQEHFTETMTPASLEIVRQAQERRRAAEADGQHNLFNRMEIEQYHKNGSIVWVEITSKAVYDEQHHKMGYIGLSRDITERRRAEEALKQSEERYRLVLEATNDGVWDWDIPTNTTYFSDRYYTMLGYAPGEFPATYESWRQLVHPDDLAAAEKVINDHFTQKTPEYATEFRLKTKQGNWMWIFSRGQVTERDEDGKPLRMIGTHVDITDRKLAEQTLRESEQHYRTLIENMPIVCFTYDQHGTVLSWNKEAERVYGYTEEEAVGHSAYDLIVTPATLEATKAVIQQVFDGQVVKGTEWQDRNKHGVIGWRFGNTFPLFHSDGSVKVGVNMNIDITEKKTTEEELTKYREQLEELVKKRTAELEIARDQAEAANRAKSTFLANMSHELRTPLNAILGFSQLMTRDSEVSASQRENLAIINRSGKHLLMLINSILDMSKIEAEHAELELSSFDVDHMLTSIEEMMRVRTETKRLQFLMERDPDLPRYIKTDERKLRQILINLLSNAVKFTEEGKVHLRVYELHEFDELEELKTQKLKNSKTQKLCFKIEDTGIGIPQNALDHIFEPFAQTSSGLQTAEGTGLGLAISRQFARLLGGDVTVTSQVGTGSVFTFAIPVEPTGMEQLEQQQTMRRVIGLAPDQRSVDGSPYRILIAEDKELNRILLQRLLETIDPSGQGFDVRTAVNGQKALEIVEQWQPHLIFMDMRMPVMDGYEATKRIREAEDSIQHPASGIQHRTPIIALTASAFEEDRKKVLATGCDDFVRKPFKEEDIFSILGKHLGIQFVYEEEKQVAGSKKQIARKEALTPEALVALPPGLLADLEQATDRSDMQQIVTLIEEIRTHDPAVADALRLLADEFQYDEMLRLIQKARSA